MASRRPLRHVLKRTLVAFALACGVGRLPAGEAGPPGRGAGEADRFVEAGRDWWAFRPVARPRVPEVEDRGWARNPIDAFIRSAQAELGLSPSPEADRVALIRRLAFDLTGLPPSPAEVDAFLADGRADAYERLVDRLLASPAFGERWGRYWLDLVRYSDTDGFELDGRRPDAWRYRDWVVGALNEDLPYDRFVRLQLAADELAPDEPRHKAALAFLRLGPSVGNQKSEKIRMDELDDIVSTTSGAFLGLTVGCARCHDHKYDPIPVEDYYRLVAVFAPGRFADVPLATADEQARYRQATRDVDERADRFRTEILAIERQGRDRLEAEKRAALPEAWRKALDTGDVKGLTKDEQADLARRIKIEPGEVAAALTPSERTVLDEWRARVDAAEAARPAPLPKVPGVVESGRRASPVHLLVRGSVDHKGPAVRPGPPRAIAGRVIDFPEAADGATSTGRRSALAAWITSADNPLTARVQVNRIWQGHFGAGLVPTPSDFGASGDGPTSPELLDWLAAEFAASGWSQKALHRLIVTSKTYRQSSRLRAEMQEIDPDNTLLWRSPMRRLEAEAIRDGILRCAGTLDEARGGPGVFPPIDPSVVRTGNVPRWPLDARDGPEVWRRSLYIFQMRSVPFPLLELFDLPDSTQSCPKRAQTTIPTQGLSLLNNPFVLGQARRFAERVAREAGPEAVDRLALAFRLTTGRAPGESARRAALEFLDRRAAWYAEHREPTAPDLAALADLGHVLMTSNAFLYID